MDGRGGRAAARTRWRGYARTCARARCKRMHDLKLVQSRKNYEAANTAFAQCGALTGRQNFHLQVRGDHRARQDCPFAQDAAKQAQ
eukprot:365028-Chlamydomonas_euryale.AAC.45